MATCPKTIEEPFADYQARWLDGIAARKSNYWVGFVSDPAAALFFVFWDLVILRISIYALIASLITGLLSWSLFEYCFHRWVYHRGHTLAHAGHTRHHESPKALVGMPWFLTTGFLLGFWFVFAYLFQVRFLLSFMAGLVTGFVIYGTFHHIHHHHPNLNSSWYRNLGKHHTIHHRFPGVNFGVTNRLWDYIFGTTYRKDERNLSILLKREVPTGKHSLHHPS
jgi:hypothetical protein